MRATITIIEFKNERRTFQSLALAFKIVKAYKAEVSLPGCCQSSCSLGSPVKNRITYNIFITEIMPNNVAHILKNII